MLLTCCLHYCIGGSSGITSLHILYHKYHHVACIILLRALLVHRNLEASHAVSIVSKPELDDIGLKK